MHDTASPLAGQTVTLGRDLNTLNGTIPAGTEYVVEDWWDHLTGRPWGVSDGNPACLAYAMRSAFSVPPLPLDDEVLYGKVGPFGHLVHVTELAAVDDCSALQDDVDQYQQDLAASISRHPAGRVMGGAR